MMICPSCGGELSPSHRFCPSCGAPASSLSQAPTAAVESPAAPVAIAAAAIPTPVGRLISSDSLPVGGFTPGMVLAGRYRIIGLIGRGGMGEVYRADDLKLGQPVALKFLPPKLAEDPVRRERFFAEVRITRQLSHPNICRVYDIGEIDGRHFLSMEFIDGEDLASLLKRIGYLSKEKALDIARQLAAGLAAAHERGVLHRDLKPANIMLDGHGRVRITDFGLAIVQEDEGQAVTEIAGTPAYMAPEQLAGKGSTVRSDIYSLGLVLYEVYTGKKAFSAKTLPELREQKETHTPRAASEIREGIDPVVERLIRRCMERDPNARPASVAQLALALPGGDPLTAALAAGETPSPEMVAASGSKEGLRPAVAWGILAFVLFGLLATLAIKDRVAVHRRIPFEISPESLADRSRLFLKKAGYSEKYADSAYGFVENSDLLNYIENSDKTANRWNKLDSTAILFWYRQSPRQLNASTPGDMSQAVVRIAPHNPPLQHPGEALIMLDTEARLVSLQVVPLQLQSKTAAVSQSVWTIPFAEAGLDISKWTPIEAQQIPHFFADTRAAWLPDLPGISVRIEAAAFQGRLVNFEIIKPWYQRTQMPSVQLRINQLVAGIGQLLFFILILLGGIFFARRNLRLGRGDRRNATRLALFIYGSIVFVSVLRAPGSLLTGLGEGPFIAIMTWILYLAIEPYVRRRWPQILVSWTRLLSGGWRDPLVARDTLIGFAFGVFVGFITICIAGLALPSELGAAEFSQRLRINLDGLLGGRFTISNMIATGLLLNTYLLLGAICLLVIMRFLLRSDKAAIIACVLICTMMLSHHGFSYALIASTLFCFVLMRFGLLAATLGAFANTAIRSSPMTLQSSAWYFGYGLAALAIFAAIILYAFRYSLGGQPLFGRASLED